MKRVLGPGAKGELPDEEPTVETVEADVEIVDDEDE